MLKYWIVWLVAKEMQGMNSFLLNAYVVKTLVSITLCLKQETNQLKHMPHAFFDFDDVSSTSLMFKLSKRVNRKAKETVKSALSAGKRVREGHMASSLPLIG